MSHPRTRRRGIPIHVWRFWAAEATRARCEACGFVVGPADEMPTAAEVPCVEKWGPKDRRTKRRGIYIASKSVHGPRWCALRASGVPVISTWIDESGEDQTSDWADLWDRCIHEASTAAVMIVYVEPGEVHKGSLVELGAALHAGVPVLWVGPEYSTAPRHRLVRRVETIEDAIREAATIAQGDAS